MMSQVCKYLHSSKYLSEAWIKWLSKIESNWMRWFFWHSKMMILRKVRGGFLLRALFVKIYNLDMLKENIFKENLRLFSRGFCLFWRISRRIHISLGYFLLESKKKTLSETSKLLIFCHESEIHTHTQE